MKIYQFNIMLMPKKEIYLPNFLGEAIRGALLKILQQKNPEFSAYLHNKNEIRKYAVGKVYGGKKQFHGQYDRKRANTIKVNPESRLDFSLKLIGDNIATSFIQGILDVESATMILLGHEMSILEVRFKSHEILDLIRNSEPNPPQKINLDFLTPTRFESRGTKFPILFPLPSFLFGSLVTLWNAILPDAKMDRRGVNNYISDNVYVKAHRLYTREIPSKYLRLTGFEGWTQLRITDTDNEFASCIMPLLKIGTLLNVGEKRTIGFGCVKITNT